MHVDAGSITFINKGKRIDDVLDSLYCFSDSVCIVRSLQVLVQGCQLDRTDLDQFLLQIYQQLRSVENNIAEVLQQQYRARGQVSHCTGSKPCV